MQNIEIEALKYLSKDIEFVYLEDNLEKSYKGFVDAVVIESQEITKFASNLMKTIQTSLK